MSFFYFLILFIHSAASARKVHPPVAPSWVVNSGFENSLGLDKGCEIILSNSVKHGKRALEKGGEITEQMALKPVELFAPNVQSGTKSHMISQVENKSDLTFWCV